MPLLASTSLRCSAIPPRRKVQCSLPRKSGGEVIVTVVPVCLFVIVAACMHCHSPFAKSAALQDPGPEGESGRASEGRCDHSWRAVGVGPCRGGVLGPPLAASRREEHVPLGASPSRFLPVAIALLAAPPPRPPSRADRADLEGSVVATGCASFTHVCHEPPPHPFHPLFTDPCPALLSPLVWYHRSGEQ
jgi:hypothetical protein